MWHSGKVMPDSMIDQIDNEDSKGNCGALFVDFKSAYFETRNCDDKHFVVCEIVSN